MEYFKGLTGDALKTQHRKLISKMHPDRGGNTAAFQEMQRQFEVASGVRRETRHEQRSDPFEEFKRGFVRGTEQNPRVVDEGEITLSPYNIRANTKTVRDSENNRWVFSTQDLFKYREFSMRKQVNGEWLKVKLTPKYIVQEKLIGTAELCYDDNKEYVFVVMSEDGYPFAGYRLYDLDRFKKHFRTDRDAVVDVRLPPEVCAKMKMSRFEQFNWDFPKGGTIHLVLKRRKMGWWENMWYKTDKFLDKFSDKMKGF